MIEYKTVMLLLMLVAMVTMISGAWQLWRGGETKIGFALIAGALVVFLFTAYEQAGAAAQ